MGTAWYYQRALGLGSSGHGGHLWPLPVEVEYGVSRQHMIQRGGISLICLINALRKIATPHQGNPHIINNMRGGTHSCQGTRCVRSYMFVVKQTYMEGGDLCVFYNSCYPFSSNGHNLLVRVVHLLTLWLQYRIMYSGIGTTPWKGCKSVFLTRRDCTHWGFRWLWLLVDYFYIVNSSRFY